MKNYTWQDYDALYESYVNGNTSTVRDEVQAMSVADVMLMTAYLLTRVHSEDVRRFARSMSQ